MPGQTWLDVLDILAKENITRRMKLNVDEVMVHSKNRGGIGVNHFNVHRNGARIVSIGIDPQELAKAVCFLMPPGPAKRQQIAFNQRLIDRSKGMLAPLTGKEIALSVGTGHTTAFLRSLKAGCKTPVKKLQDSCGKLNAESFRCSRMNAALHAGWYWTVLPYECEVTWPGLPDLAQSALNANNSVPSLPSELEITCEIAQHQAETDMSLDECVSTVREMHPTCQAWVSFNFSLDS